VTLIGASTTSITQKNRIDSETKPSLKHILMHMNITYIYTGEHENLFLGKLELVNQKVARSTTLPLRESFFFLFFKKKKKKNLPFVRELN
jgi:hypothetical protein